MFLPINLSFLLLYLNFTVSGISRYGHAAALNIGPLALIPGAVSPPPTSPGVRLLFQNDLQWDTTADHTGRLLIEKKQTYERAARTCQDLSEKLATVPLNDNDLQRQLRYLVYKGNYAPGQSFWVGNGANQTLRISNAKGAWTVQKASPSSVQLPALCTQSAARRQANNSDTSDEWQISVGDGPTFTGYRDALSFRFWAVPYADSTPRFAYSSVYSGTGTIDATSTGRSRQCPQRGGTDYRYAEDCLVLSLYTPYLPPSGQSAKNAKDLRPIFLWIHGGGLNTGSGLDYTFDGGHMSSRGDVVVVNINYRLGTLGFLAYNDQIKGNFGLADIVTALKWLKRNAATFGGDASRITVAGQSAGANLVTQLIGSPAASGLFHRAIIQSGRPADSYNQRATVAEARAKSTAAIVDSLGCSDAPDALSCLRQVSVSKILSTSAFSTPVLDGTYVTTKKYVLSGEGGHVNRVPTIIGYMRDELGSLGYVPYSDATNLTQELIAAGIPPSDIDVINSRSDVFSVAIPNGIQNLTVTVETNNRTVSRCGLSATAYSAVAKKVLTNVWAYTQDQRAFQIPNYDPNGVCQPQDGALPSDGSAYYFCHSGDLIPTFVTAGYGFSMDPRDDKDVPWIRNQVDQWTSLVRTGDPNPASDYNVARGYASVSGDAWPKVSASAGPSGAKMLSLGPRQKVVPLAQHASQCGALGRGLTYISSP
ncbi:unnamed protein product [Parajaminaea phylloscopi]